MRVYVWREELVARRGGRWDDGVRLFCGCVAWKGNGKGVCVRVEGAETRRELKVEVAG